MGNEDQVDPQTIINNVFLRRDWQGSTVIPIEIEGWNNAEKKLEVINDGYHVEWVGCAGRKDVTNVCDSQEEATQILQEYVQFRLGR